MLLSPTPFEALSDSEDSGMSETNVPNGFFCDKCNFFSQGFFCPKCGARGPAAPVSSSAIVDQKQQPPIEPPKERDVNPALFHYYSFPKISDGDTGILPSFSFFSSPSPARPMFENSGAFFCKACQVQSATMSCLQCGARHLDRHAVGSEKRNLIPRSPSPVFNTPAKSIHPLSSSGLVVTSDSPTALEGRHPLSVSFDMKEKESEPSKPSSSSPRPRPPPPSGPATYFSFPRIADGETMSFSSVLGAAAAPATAETASVPEVSTDQQSSLGLSSSTNSLARGRSTTLTRQDSRASLADEFEQRLDGLSARDRANWMSDKSCKYCYECQIPFTFFKRRHHCRLCGQIFCNSCSSMTVNSTTGSVRVCRHCSSLATKFQQVAAPAPKLKTDVHSSTVPPLIPEAPPPPMCPSRCGCPLNAPFDECTCTQCKPGLKPRTRDPNQQLGLFRDEEDEESDTPEDPSGGGSHKEPMVADHRHKTRVPPPTPSSMITSTSAAEDFPTDEVTEDKEEEEEEDFFSNFKAAEEVGDLGPQEESDVKKSDDKQQGGSNERALSRLESYFKFQKLAYHHLAYATALLLLGEGVSSHIQWQAKVLDLAGTVTRCLRACPRTRGDDMDLRMYFATKIVPEKLVNNDCQYVSGVVFRKNLAHRRMRSHIPNPRVLLLSCALEYDRVARMSAFDTLVAQEEEFIKIQVGKIIRLSPDVVVVEKTVSRLAQDLLLEANITLLLNVKRSVLEKLSRFTQTSILFSTDFAAHFEDRLGSCLLFRTETIKLQGEKVLSIGAGRKPEATLVFFQGHTSRTPLSTSSLSTTTATSTTTTTATSITTNTATATTATNTPSLYSTIILRGEDEVLLRKIKRVLTTSIELAHNLMLQSSFLDDSCTTFPDQLVGKEIGFYTKEIAQAQAMEPTNVTCIPSSPFISLPPLKKSVIQKLRQPDLKMRVMSSDEGEVQRPHTPLPGVGYDSVPWLQQGIVFSSCSLTKRGQCNPPQLEAVDFFRSNSDKSMGEFLIQNCFEQQLRCTSSSCKAKNKRHVMALTHATGTVLILAKKIPRTEMPKPSRSQTPLPTFLRRTYDTGMQVSGLWAPQAPWKDFFRVLPAEPTSYSFDHSSNDEYASRNPRIMMWSLCKACDKNVTPCVAMSDQSFNSSFGQFLDTTFNNSQLTGRTGKCGHVIRDSHVRFFGLNPSDQSEEGLVVAFEYHPISLSKVLIDTVVSYNWAQTFAMRSSMLVELGQVALLCFQGFDTKLYEIEDILKQSECVDQTVLALLSRLKKWILNEKEIFMVVLTSYPEKARAQEREPVITAVAVNTAPQTVVTTSTLSSSVVPASSSSSLSTSSSATATATTAAAPSSSSSSSPSSLTTSETTTSTTESSSPSASTTTAQPTITTTDTTTPVMTITLTTTTAVIPPLPPPHLTLTSSEPEVPHATMTSVVTTTMTNQPAPEQNAASPSSTIASPVTLHHDTSPTVRISSASDARDSNAMLLSVIIHTPPELATPSHPKDKSNEKVEPLRLRSSLSTTQTVADLDVFDLYRLQRRLFVNFIKWNKMLRTLTAYTAELLYEMQEDEKETLPSLDDAPASSAPPAATGLRAAIITPSESSSTVVLNTNNIAPSRTDRMRDLVNSLESAVAALTKPKDGRTRATTTWKTGPNVSVKPSLNTPSPEVTLGEDKALPPLDPSSRQRSVYEERSGGNPSLERLHGLEKTIGLVTMSETTTNLPQDAFDFLNTSSDHSSFHFTPSDDTVGHVECPVYDDEPSSVISHCLSSVDHYNLLTKGMSWEEVVQTAAPAPEDLKVKVEMEDSPTNELEDLQREMQNSKLNLKRASCLAVILQAQARKRKRAATMSTPSSGKPGASGVPTTPSSTNMQPLSSPNDAMKPLEWGMMYNPTPWALTSPPSSLTAPPPLSLASTLPSPTSMLAFASPSSCSSSSASSFSSSPKMGEDKDKEREKGEKEGGVQEKKVEKALEDWNLEDVMSDRSLLKSVEEILLLPNTPEDIETVFENSYQEEDVSRDDRGAGSGKMEFVCKAYYAKQFHALRYMCCEGGEFQFLQSLARGNKWKALGGKSGSTFARTKDGRYVLKYVSGHEFRMFLDYAPQYFAHMAKAIFHQLPSALVRILGVFQLKILSKRTDWANSAKVKSKYAIVQPNLFYDRRPDRVFDLKGSMRNRYAKDTALGSRAAVQLDQNFMEFTRACTEGLPRRYEQGLPSALYSSAKQLLNKAVFNDTIFLAQNEVVDYSILVGFDLAKHEVVVGVIDYIRKYTWDKKLETGVKSVGMIAGKELPTVIAPSSYKSRFRKAMDHYFMNVPSHVTHVHLLGLPHTPLRYAYRTAEGAFLARREKEDKTGQEKVIVKSRLGHLEHGGV